MTQMLDSPAFNLIDEAWIPCIRTDGTTAELGLRDVLGKAHELSGLYGESPLIVASLYRLLLALMYSIYGNPSESSWAKSWQAGRLDEEKLNAYWKEWHERFYLFHPERPFYQWADGANREKTLVDMLPELSSGNAATLFDHHVAGEHYFSPAQAIRALLLVQTFSIAGGNGLAPKESSDAPWARGVVFLAEGNSVFETLMLNFMSADQAQIFPKEGNQAFWENQDPFKPDRDTPLGLSDYLSWPIRKIHLIPTEFDGRLWVSDVRMGTGLKLNPEFLNPFYHYRIDNGYKMQRFNEDRLLWRDTASFFSFHRQANFYPPRVFDWIGSLAYDGVIEANRAYRFLALGMANNQAKVDFYSMEHLPLPPKYLRNKKNVDGLQTAIEAAENVRKKLYGGLSRLATLLLSPAADLPDGRQPDSKDIQNLVAHWAAERHYWANLETPFFQLMRDLPEKGEDAIIAWNVVLQETAREALEYACRMAGDDVRALRAAVKARGQLAGGLKKLFEDNQ